MNLQCSATLFEDKNVVKTEGCMQHVSEYMSASGDVIIRSLLLTGSVYAMSVAAGNLGTPTFRSTSNRNYFVDADKRL